MEKEMETTIFFGLLCGSIPSFVANQRQVLFEIRYYLGWDPSTNGD